MLDPLFSFVDPILDTNEGDMFPFLAKMVDSYFEIVVKKRRDRAMSLPEGINLKTGMLLDIALSLIHPDELEKLRNYVAAYMVEYHSTEKKRRKKYAAPLFRTRRILFMPCRITLTTQARLPTAV